MAAMPIAIDSTRIMAVSLAQAAIRRNRREAGYHSPTPMKHLAAILVLLTGCAIGRQAENEPLETVKLEKLVPGKTTAKEVVELFGAPVDVIQLGRRSAYLYRHIMNKTTGIVLIVVNFLNQDHREDRLWVFFDEQGTLTHYGSTTRAKDTRIAAPWQDLYKDDEKPDDKTEATPPADDKVGEKKEDAPK